MDTLRLGVAGLGRGFMLMLPGFTADPRVILAAAADPRPEARAAFARDFGGRAYDSVEALCADDGIDVVYVASPHQFHAEHTQIAAQHGRHVLVEKPMALTLADCETMIAAAEAAGVQLVIGHSHSFDRPYARTRALIESGAFGALRMIQTLNFTDFLYRPRRPEELDPDKGGGAIANQAPHQIDILRLLAGAPVKSVRAASGRWDPARPVDGAYLAFLAFEGGIHATASYSGYGHFDSDELTGWIGEMGQRRDPVEHGAARRRLEGADEAALKAARAYGMAKASVPKAEAYNHFGSVLVSCEKADLRPMPNGVWIYGDAERRFEALPPPAVPRVEVIDELYAAVVGGVAPLHDGRWGRDTMAVCLALRQSAREGKEVAL